MGVVGVESGGGNLIQDLNSLVAEYLEFNGLTKSLESFTTECHIKQLPCPDVTPSTGRITFTSLEADALIHCFDSGDSSEFFRLWKLFQSHIQVTTDDMEKLEAYIRVHFALWPRANGRPIEEQESAMAELKDYFEEAKKGSLGKDASVVPLLALPFVQDPFSHPVFKELFRDLWTKKLRLQLETTLEKYFQLLHENICQHSRLARLWLGGSAKKSISNNNNKALPDSNTNKYQEERFFQLLLSLRKTRSRLQASREEHRKLLEVTAEMAEALENLSQRVPNEEVQEVFSRCAQLNPQLFKSVQRANENKQQQVHSEFLRSMKDTIIDDSFQESEMGLFVQGLPDLAPSVLDFEKIRIALENESNSSSSAQLCLLQALRWTITKTGGEARSAAVAGMKKHDVLVLKGDPKTHPLWKHVLLEKPSYIKECLSRLVNSLSSVREGRGYLSSSNFLPGVLVQALKTLEGPSDAFIRQMIIASLQKLSLRKSVRLFLIGQELISWLVRFVNRELEQGSSSYYSLEFALALFMNLSMHSEAWPSCVGNKKGIFKMVAGILSDVDKMPVWSYVVSSMFNLLRSPEMYAHAKQASLETALKPALDTRTEYADLLTYLIAEVNMDGKESLYLERETDFDDNDGDSGDENFEPEIEAPEHWTKGLGENELQGDVLLIRKYLLPPGKYSNKQKQQQRHNRKVMTRPMTPGPQPSPSTWKSPSATEKPLPRVSKGSAERSEGGEKKKKRAKSKTLDDTISATTT